MNNKNAKRNMTQKQRKSHTLKTQNKTNREKKKKKKKKKKQQNG